MQKFKRLILFAVGLIILVVLYAQNPDSLSELGELSISSIVIILLIQLATLIINGYFTTVLIRELLTDKFRPFDGFYATFISSYGNYFLPMSGGFALRAVYLKRKFNMAYKKYISTLYGTYIVSFLGTSTFTLFAVLQFWREQDTFATSLFVISLGLFVFTAALMSRRFRLDEMVFNLLGRIPLPFFSGLQRRANGIIASWLKIVTNRRLLYLLLVLTALNILVRILFYWFVFDTTGNTISIAATILFNSIISLSLYINIMPGGLAIREGVLLLFASTLMISSEDTLSVSLIDRASLLLVLIGVYLVLSIGRRATITSEGDA